MTDQSEIDKMKSEANRELNGIKYKKSKVTRNINQCLTLLEVCKGEAQSNSPLSRQSAEDTMTHYNRAQNSLNELEASMERYLTLLTQTYRDEDNVPIDETEEDNQDGLQILIDKNLESISGYTS